MKRYYPAFFLAAAPYLFLITFYIVATFNFDFSINIYTYLAIIVLIYLPNTIFTIVLLVKREQSSRILFWNFVLKLCHIPSFILTFIFGLILSMVIIFTFPLLVILIVGNYLLLLATSAYGIIGIVRATVEGKIALSYALLHIFLHFIFMADFVSAAMLYFQSRELRFGRYSRSFTPGHVSQE